MQKKLNNLQFIWAALKAAIGKPLTDVEQMYMNLYAIELSSYITKGENIPLANLAYTDIQLGYNFLGTTDTVHKMYCITGADIDYDGKLFLDLKRKINEVSPDIYFSIQVSTYPINYNTRNKRFISSSANATRKYETIKNYFTSLPIDVQERGARVGSQLINKAYLKRLEDEFKSYQFIKEETKKAQLGASYLILHTLIPADRKDELQILLESTFNDYALLNELQIKEVRRIKDYLHSLSPISLRQDKDLFFDVNAILSNSSNLTDQLDTTPGLEGDDGIHFGTIVENNTQLYIDFKKSPQAQVILIIAKAGSGKSDLMKAALESHILNGDYIDIVDYKGTDYIGLEELYPDHVNILNMEKGVYPNMFDLSEYPNPDDSTKDDVSGYIVDVLIALLDLQPKVIDLILPKLDALFTELIGMYYEHYGVYSAKDYYKTKVMSFSNFWAISRNSLKTSKTFEESYSDVISTVLLGLDQYFTSEGKKKAYFRKQINLSQLLSSKVIVYSFHSINKDKKDMKTVLSYMFMNCISLMRNNKIKSERNMQVLVFEELQEASNDIGMLRTMAKRATVSRSANVTMYTLLNNIEMFRLTGVAEVDKALSSLLACYTTYFIGYMEEGNTQFVKDNLRVSTIEEHIDKINNELTKDEYKYHFAFKYDTGDRSGSGMCVQLLPQSYRENSLYITRNIK